MKTFLLHIRTPLETAFEGQVSKLHVDTDAGRIVILPGHAPLTSTITFSKAKIVSTSGEIEVFIKRGTLSVSLETKSVDLMCISCEEQKEVSIQTIEDYLKMIEEKLSNKESLSAYQIQYLKDEKVAFEKQKQSVEK
jgi:F0F1-type ATP synthase epsilon subunit